MRCENRLRCRRQAWGLPFADLAAQMMRRHAAEPATSGTTAIEGDRLPRQGEHPVQSIHELARYKADVDKRPKVADLIIALPGALS